MTLNLCVKVKADNPVDFQDVASLVAMTGYYATSEPFIESRCDIHIEKIGDFYKAFALVAFLCTLLLCYFYIQ